MKKMLKSFSLIINYKTFILTAMAVLSSYLCFHLNLTAKFPDMLVGVAIVFPVVFSIGSAYARRETALQRYSDFKGHAIAIYFAARDWSGRQDADTSTRAMKTIHQMLRQVKHMVKLKNGAAWAQEEKNMYAMFSELSKLTIEFRGHGVQSGEVSRVS